jgi:hypothetical protein
MTRAIYLNLLNILKKQNFPRKTLFEAYPYLTQFYISRRILQKPKRKYYSKIPVRTRRKMYKKGFKI